MADFTTTIGLSDRDLARGFVAAKKTAKNGMRGIENEVRQSSGRINKTIDGTLKTFITAEALVRTLRAASTLTREYADQNEYLAEQIKPAEQAIGRLRRGIGRDLAIAAAEGGGGLGGLVDGFESARTAVVNFIADGNRTLFTLSDQNGNAKRVQEAVELLALQDKRIEQIREINRLELGRDASIASAGGGTFRARDLQNQLTLLTQIQELEKKRAVANKASLTTAETAMNNIFFDRRRSLIEDDAAATQAAIDRARDHAEQLFGLRDRLQNAKIAGDQGGTLDATRELAVFQARQAALTQSIALGRSSSLRGRDQDVAEDSLRAGFFSEDRKAAENKERAAQAATSGLRVRQEQMQIQILTAQGHEAEALTLRTNLDIRQRTLEIQKQSALTDKQKADAIRAMTESARRLEQIESERIAKSKAEALTNAKDRIDALRVTALESQGRGAEARALRETIRLREFERSIREDANLSEQQKNELVAEGTSLIKQQQEQKLRGSVASLDAGLSELAGQVFGGGAGRPSLAVTPPPAVVVTHGPGTRGGGAAAAGAADSGTQIVAKLEEIKVAVEDGLGS